MTESDTDQTAPATTADAPEQWDRLATATTDQQTQDQTGMEVLAEALKTLPGRPGVYRMIGKGAEILYVGKAKNLKKRVSAYVQGRFHTNRIGFMVRETLALEVIVTASETEALLLESNLIKRHRPRYNVILRDDKSFPYILVTGDHDFPQVIKHRGARNQKGDYFGPFASAKSVNRTLNTMQKVFLLRNCTDNIFEQRTRPCLQYQIKRCSAPCVGLIDQDGYAELVDGARRFLKGDAGTLKKQLSEQMDQAAADMEFERAAALRDRIRALSHVQETENINPESIPEADVIALARDGGQICIQVFFIRAGQNWGNRAYFPRHDKDETDEAVLAAFLGQFYDNKPAPRLILTSHDADDAALIADALTMRSDRVVKISRPQRGERRAVMDHAVDNAKEALARRLAESATHISMLEGLADLFDLPAMPQRIEVYDNSHTGGTDQIGAMIVAGPEGFEKRAYRTFNIKDKTLSPGDDFGMMREVLTRRFTRLAKEEAADDPENGAAQSNRPDLVLIDGGQGQLNEALRVVAELGLTDIAMVGVAKGVDRNAGRERLFLPNDPQPISLGVRDPLLHYIQRLRDEAHRFAIGTHRAKRGKTRLKNPLDEIEGIGPKRKKALLHHFGSARAVGQASLTDLQTVEGVSEAVAKRIYDHFRG